MTILVAALATGTQHPYLGAFVLLVMGSVCFLGGFQNYRRYRILADAPRAHVRSMPMGLVHLRGKATGEPLISPLTGTRCFAYVCNIQSYVKTRSGGKTKWEWQTVSGDDDIMPFYLDDGTGRVQVIPIQPDQSSLDMPRTLQCEIGKDGHFKSVQPTPGFAPPNEQAVWAYIHGAHSRKLLEHIFEMQGERGKKMKAALETTMKLMGAAQKIESLKPSLELSYSSGAGSYRVTEQCFLADSDCVVVGTCAENPEARSEDDRIVIHQGENEKTFLISTQTEAKLGKTMRLQAVTLVLIGAALIVGGFALALHGAQLL
jgi:hypothetical protein